MSYITTRPLQCEVQQRNFFRNLPVQQRNFLQYGAFGAESLQRTPFRGFWLRLGLRFGFVWRHHISCTPRGYTCKHPTKRLRCWFSGFVFQGMCKILQDPTQNDQFYIKPSRSDFDCGFIWEPNPGHWEVFIHALMEEAWLGHRGQRGCRGDCTPQAESC